MAQRQKHWVQAMLNEDTYTPFPYFYDVTALEPGAAVQHRRAGTPAAYCSPAHRAGGAAVRPRLEAVRTPPRIALYSMSPQFSRGIESGLAALAARPLGPALPRGHGGGHQGGRRWAARGAARARRLRDAGSGRPGRSLRARRPRTDGQAAMRDWVSAAAATSAGSTARVLASGCGSPRRASSPPSRRDLLAGCAVPRAVDRRSPLGRGHRPLRVRVLGLALRDAARTARRSPVRFPAAATEDFFVSGYADGEEALGGTPRWSTSVGARADGRVRFEPNFRAFTDGTQGCCATRSSVRR